VARNSFSSIGIALVGIGSVFIYAGLKGYSILAVAQNLVTGKSATMNIGQTAPLVTTPVTGGPPPNLSDNQGLGKTLAASYGWDSGSEWTALVQLWNQESSWNNHSDNPTSHAYGIPQALPYTKMPKAAWPESAGGQSDPMTQITWGLQYIKGRYGTPSAAWKHEQSIGWY
jgi:hypothetical protein